MNFRIKNILIWPKNQENEKVNLEFDLDKVNVITGGSSRGKSAIISIIDYCLGSSVCRIPTNIIRDKTSWFGVIIELPTPSSYLLLARKEPGNSAVSNDMYMKESSLIEIPDFFETNFNVNQVKSRLDNIAGLTGFNFLEEGENSSFKSRPAFRDLVSFNFQPQHLIANQSALFYKTDLFQHREKLRTIFPYVLGAVTDEYLQKKSMLKDLNRELNALDKELGKRKKLIGKWVSELRSNYLKALELGLINAVFPEDDWTPQVYISYLKTIDLKNNTAIPQIEEGISAKVSNKVNKLEEEEIEESTKLHLLKHRYELIRKLESSNKEFRNSLLNQHGKLKSVGWFNEFLESSNDCPLCNSSNTNSLNVIKDLQKINNEILQKGAQINDNYIALSNETESIRQDILTSEKKINGLRKELELLKSSDKELDLKLQNINSIYRFAGTLETEIKNYEMFNDNSDVLHKRQELIDQIIEIESNFNEGNIENKLINARKSVSDNIKEYATIFKAEYYDDNIVFDDNNLTLSFIDKSGRENALYEIGSGANYMAYHISALLGLHDYFNKKVNSPIPSFIIFDQPTQVYFPDKSDSESLENTNVKGEDINRVERIFEALSHAFKKNNSKIQIIVIEHVGDYAWKDYKNVKLLKRWRGDSNDSYLIPKDWV